MGASQTFKFVSKFRRTASDLLLLRHRERQTRNKVEQSSTNAPANFSVRVRAEIRFYGGPPRNSKIGRNSKVADVGTEVKKTQNMLEAIPGFRADLRKRSSSCASCYLCTCT